MAIQRGKDVLLKIDVSGEGQFETVAGWILEQKYNIGKKGKGTETE